MSGFQSTIRQIATGLAGGGVFNGNANREVITVPFLSSTFAIFQEPKTLIVLGKRNFGESFCTRVNFYRCAIIPTDLQKPVKSCFSAPAKMAKVELRSDLEFAVSFPSHRKAAAPLLSAPKVARGILSTSRIHAITVQSVNCGGRRVRPPPRCS